MSTQVQPKKYLTVNQIFDKVWDHFHKKGVRLSKDHKTLDTALSCKYRLNSKPKCKTRCAAGVLIKDEVYTPELEGGNIFRTVVEAALKDSGVDLCDCHIEDTVLQLQYKHDHSNTVNEFRNKLKDYKEELIKKKLYV